MQSVIEISDIGIYKVLRVGKKSPDCYPDPHLRGLSNFQFYGWILKFGIHCIHALANLC